VLELQQINVDMKMGEPRADSPAPSDPHLESAETKLEPRHLERAWQTVMPGRRCGSSAVEEFRSIWPSAASEAVYVAAYSRE